MNLYVSCGWFMNTVLRDDRGEPRYRIETCTLLGLKDVETKITRFLPRTNASGSQGQLLVSSVNTRGETHVTARLQEEEIARIEWHRIMSTVFRRPGQNPVEVDVYMPYTGLFSRKKRAFTASNGQSYIWKAGSRRSSLLRHDGSRVAVYHHRSYGILGKAHDPFLEISPEGISIADEIVATFVYIERRRAQREKSRRGGGVQATN
ncbi:hypothetical protein DENSPDRAFT_448768 [Dentipellis sp. KUC8613]|nr:hypothetical protein DENSPDRAFT_448768 [Dentipellis sp. KUC8613]